MNMSDTLVVSRIDFDNMENHDPISKKIIKVFTDTPKETAHHKCGKWLNNQTINLYLGYDTEIYPKYVIETFSEFEE